MTEASDVYDDVAGKNLEELRKEVPARDVELKKTSINTEVR